MSRDADLTWSRRRFLSSILAVIIATAVFGLGPAPAVSAEKQLKIVATTGMIGDAARNVGGEHVAVRALMGAGVDPHAYRQTRTDIVAMTKADLVLRHGLYLEAQMEDFMGQLTKKRKVIAVAEGVSKDLLRAHDIYTDKYDPHIWMDPNLWSAVVMVVRDALIEARPQERETFEANAKRYLEQVTQLAEYAERIAKSVPEGSRLLLTAHDAFNYFGMAYGFEVVGIQGISTESEAGLNRIGELVDLLVARNISAVFVESSVSDRNIRALVEGAAARG
ncbi:MAG: metal ABC transporter solute-binding protein, Zn/Mn family, partial [Hyphomicrobiales bacterium]